MLDANDIEAIARRVAALLSDGPGVDGRFLDTSTVARMLSASEDWVREHAAELGAVRIGDGPRGALRFDRHRVNDALERRRLARPAPTTPRRPGPTRRPSDVTLLPLPEH